MDRYVNVRKSKGTQIPLARKLNPEHSWSSEDNVTY